jgi:hypothetical protein
MPLRTATDTGAFINSFGVVTHLEQGWQYEDAARTVSVLKELGITQVRDGFVGVGSPGRGALEYAAQQGVKFTFNIHPGWSIPTVIAQLEAWVARFPGSVMAIEGPNEVNNWPVAYQGKTGIEGAQAFQRDLYAAVNASSALKDIPVIGVTSWPVFQNDSDIGNIHAYEREGDFLTQNIKTALADENTFNPGKTVWMTEAGYHTRVGSNYHEGVSEAVQAKMIPSLFLSAFEQGIAKTFAYQLANQYPDPNTQESYFGLVNQNWTPKPAFTALKNTIAILKQGESGQHAAAGSLGYDLQGLPATAHHKLFRSDNGDWIVAVWNEPDIWNEHTNTEIQNPTSLVSLKLDQTHPGLTLFDPLTGTAAIQSATNANALTFTLDDHPIFIKIQPFVSQLATPEIVPDETSIDVPIRLPRGQTKIGTAGADVLKGGAGNDKLDGRGGGDKMIGGAGNDTYRADSNRDVVEESVGGGFDLVYATRSFRLTAGSEIEHVRAETTEAINLYGNAFDNHVQGNGKQNVLAGGAGNDRLVGLGANDTLRGDAGDDLLSGGSGRDSFVFNTLYGVDTITDYVVRDDTIKFDRKVFTAFERRGLIRASEFVIGSQANDEDDQIIYDQATGALFYDPDGVDAGAQQQFAQLKAGLTLTSRDFFVF